MALAFGAALPLQPRPAAALVRDDSASGSRWPLWTIHDTPSDSRFELPPGVRVRDVDIQSTSDATRALVVTEQPDRSTQVLVWMWSAPPDPIEGLASPGATILEVAVGPFDNSILVVEQGAFGTRIVPIALRQFRMPTRASPLYQSKGLISHLRVPLLRYEGNVRVFFADTLTPNGKPRILSVTSRGDRRYEVTSPTGAPGDATEPKLRVKEGDFTPANVAKSQGAWPISFHPRTGALSWTDVDGRLFVSDYVRSDMRSTGNWAPARRVDAPTGARLSFSPNGAFSVRFVPGEKGVVVQVAGGTPTRVCPEFAFAMNPAIAPSGKTLVGFVRADDHDTLISCPVDVPLADVAFLEEGTRTQAVRDRLTRSGLSVRDTKGDYIWSPYDELGYDDPCFSLRNSPMYATIDGFIEVLAAGTRAALANVERRVSRERLARVINELTRAASERGLARVAGIARQSARLLAGDYSGDEGVRVLGALHADSAWHGKDTAFEATKPLGIYAWKGGDTLLADYYRAFSYLNLTTLSLDEAKALAADERLANALAAWREPARRFVAHSSRETAALGPSVPRAPFVIEECLSDEVKNTRRLFPLAWGVDSEIVEGVVKHTGVPERCSVPERLSPTGLDLLVGLGSQPAKALAAAEEKEFPGLASAHDLLVARFGTPRAPDTFFDHWLRLVQVIATDSEVPRGVSPDRWKARLQETALASWVSLRHTTVLYNEIGASECGDAEFGFESLEMEPIRGVVDPVPEAWRQVGDLLARLATETHPVSEPLARLLRAKADVARDFGSMAERQMRGEPLTEPEYTLISRYSGEVEHPVMMLDGSVAGNPSEWAVAVPTPLAKAVPILRIGASERYWHVALGRPRAVTAVLHDRGQRSVGVGAWYSYYESVGPLLDDEAWRAQVDNAPRPSWVTVDEQR